MKVIVNGCNGTMGQVLCNEIIDSKDLSIAAGIDRNPNKISNSFKTYDNIDEFNDNADVIIDFSNPCYIDDLLSFATKKRIPIVIATTGFSDKDFKNIEKSSKDIPIFISSNMSLGVNVLLDMVKKASKVLGDSFDIEIIEKHHNQKVDSPSGTAYMIADNINNELNNSKEYVFGRVSKKDKRNNNEIGIHAIRAGNIVGEHNVIFAGKDEIIEIKHTANSKKIFAQGSIKAAHFLIKQNNGLYNMDDLLK